MPYFRIELERQVSRVVELRQTAKVTIKASNSKEAIDAAWSVAGDHELFHDHATDWEDDDGSRQASNDEVVERPRPRYYAVPVLAAPANFADASKILGIED